MTAPDRRPIVISGPSGVGNGTLIQKLLDAHPGIFATTVSHTTRKPRAHEADGVAYFFVSETEFVSLISRNAFVEHAFFSGNHYGTSKQTIIDQTAEGSVVVLDIELQGVKSLKADPNFEARYIFIKAPSFEDLETRLRSRSTEKESDIQKRLAPAAVELEWANTAGFHNTIIVNDDLEIALQELQAFIFGSGSEAKNATGGQHPDKCQSVE